MSGVEITAEWGATGDTMSNVPIPMPDPRTASQSSGGGGFFDTLGSWVDGAFDLGSGVASSWFDWKTAMSEYDAKTALANAQAEKARAIQATAQQGVTGQYDPQTGTYQSGVLPDWFLPVALVAGAGLVFFMAVKK